MHLLNAGYNCEDSQCNWKLKASSYVLYKVLTTETPQLALFQRTLSVGLLQCQKQFNQWNSICCMVGQDKDSCLVLMFVI